MQKEKINTSIVIAVYNAEKRLEEVIKSLLSQDYGKPYEIILVDDGSTDNSLKIMQEYAKKHKKINALHQKNKGAAAARNLGIKNARGKYLVITDDDVLLEKKWLKKTIPLLEDKNVGWVSSLIKNDEPKGLDYFGKLLFDYALASRDADLKNQGPMLMCNATRKEIFNEVGLYDSDFDGSGAGADIDVHMRIVKKGYKPIISDAVANHLETKQRFSFGFFIKKPYHWGKAIGLLAKKEGLERFDPRLTILLIPIPLILFILLLVSSFFNPLFILGLPILFLVYFYYRKSLVRKLMDRKRNIFEIVILMMLDTSRVFIYNLGSISYFLLPNKKKRLD